MEPLSSYQVDKVNKVEVVQKRATRFTTNRYRNTSSVPSMLHHVQWESLEPRRCKIQLTRFYKVVQGLVDIEAAEYLTQSTTRTGTAHTEKFRQFSSSTDCFKFSFPSDSYLSATTADVHSLVSFRKGLSTLSFYAELGRGSVAK